MTKKVTDDLEVMRFNTAIAALIEWLNALYKQEDVARETATRFALLLSPFAPHLGEELWSVLGHGATLAYERWPTWDDALLVSTTQTLAVQVNGKTRGTIEVAADADAASVLEAARGLERVAAQLEGKTVLKEIVVPGKIVNLIAR